MSVSSTRDPDLPVWSVSELDTIVDVLPRAVAACPEALFLDFSGTEYTYAQVWQLAQRRAAGLKSLGLRGGQTLVCLLDNNIDAVTSWFAANLLGAIWVPVNTALKGREKPEVRTVLDGE